MLTRANCLFSPSLFLITLKLKFRGVELGDSGGHEIRLANPTEFFPKCLLNHLAIALP